MLLFIRLQTLIELYRIIIAFLLPIIKHKRWCKIMARKYLNAEELNKQISKTLEAGYTPPTQLYRIQNRFARIVIDNSLRNPGYIRTMEEANDFLLKQYGNRAHLLTQQDYNEILRELQDELGIERTFQGVVRKQREHLFDIVSDMNDYMDENFDPQHLTTKQLYEAVKLAGEKARSDSAGSPSFYEYLADILSSI